MRRVALACAVLAFVGCGKHTTPLSKSDDAVPVQIATADSGSALAAVATGGRVVGARETLVSWKIGGRVTRLRVRSGHCEAETQ